MDPINQALYIDTMLLLPGNNLVKPDRMGMAVSIENRAPFLDYRMVELAFSIPGELKLADGRRSTSSRRRSRHSSATISPIGRSRCSRSRSASG